MPWDQLASEESLQKTIAALKNNAIEALVVANGAEAKQKLFELLPAGAEVMDMSSTTLKTIGAVEEIQESGKYRSVKKELMGMNRETQNAEMQKLGAAPEWAVGSVHAVTEEGEVLIASASGSQLPAYAGAALHVIWVVGTQKIVPNRDAGLQRIYEHCLPLESERVKKAYNWPGSSVNKILIINKEPKPQRVTLIFVKEVLGF